MADAAASPGRTIAGQTIAGRAFGAEPYRGLRGWIDMVDRLGELKRVSGAHWDVEMGAITHMLTEKSGGTAPAILFDDVPGYPKGYRTLYGQLSSVTRIAFTLGLPLEHERKSRYRAALPRPHAGFEAATAALRQ
jgi:3-polyprenyl-4-hydroxybenzoate decarboxylase